MRPPAASPLRIGTAPAARPQDPGTAASTRKNNLPPQTAAPALSRKSQPADAKCCTPASDLLDVLQAVPARRHHSGTHPPARTRPRERPAGKQPSADMLAQHRAAAAPGQLHPHSARYGKPNTAAAAGQPTPPAAPPDGIARPGPGLHYTNWSRPISQLV
jgi:hypothetical protein